MLLPIKIGDRVKIEYTLTLNDGTIIDTSEGGNPLEFEVGSGRVIKGLDQAVIGMEKGEEKLVKIEPKDAYGYRKPEWVKRIPRDKLPPDLEEDMTLRFTMFDGTQISGRIIKITEEEVTVDFNHPLAGLVLNFKIKIV